MPLGDSWPNSLTCKLGIGEYNGDKASGELIKVREFWIMYVVVFEADPDYRTLGGYRRCGCGRHIFSVNAITVD